jgi:hypothetical protein
MASLLAWAFFIYLFSVEFFHLLEGIKLNWKRPKVQILGKVEKGTSTW